MKAVVLQTQGHEAAILVNDGTVRIAHGKYSVGDIIEYKKVVRRNLLQWAAAAAAMVVLAGIGTGLWIDRNYVTYAEVSLDVNPSIVYSINRRDRVLSVRAANDDAISIVKQLQGIRFSPLSEAVENTMTLLENEGYLDADTDDYVLVNVSADDDTRQNRLTAEVETAMATTMEQDSTIEYRIDHSDRETARQARDRGMSVGRYSSWQKQNDRPNPEDYAEKPVRELMGGDPEEAGHPRSDDADRREDTDGREMPSPSANSPQKEEPPSDPQEEEPPSDPQEEEPPSDKKEPSGGNQKAEKPQTDQDRQSEHQPAQQAPSDRQPDKPPEKSTSQQSKDKAEPGKSAEQRSQPRKPKGEGHQAPPNGGKQGHK